MRIPKLCRHRGSGRSYVTDPRTGREVYFGITGAPETHAAYAEWVRDYTRAVGVQAKPVVARKTMAGLMADYLDWARGRYRRENGTPSSHYVRVRTVCRRLISLGYDSLVLAELTRQHVLEFRATAKPHSRKYQNELASVLLTMLRWGEQRDWITAEHMSRLERIERVTARDAPSHDEVDPVPIRTLWRYYRAIGLTGKLLALHAFLACRAENACAIRLQEIDRTRTPWIYRPAQHKGSWRGRELEIRIGPRARAIIRSLEGSARNGYLFPGITSHLIVNAYWRRLWLAGKKHKLPHIQPRQIRHTSASYLLRRGVPIHIISAILGHSPKSQGITGRYAVADERDVCAVVERWG